MAKISANGATEVDRVEVGLVVYVFTSDGRVLRKSKDLDNSRFTVHLRGVGKARWATFKANKKAMAGGRG